jgi:hypothetical protein
MVKRVILFIKKYNWNYFNNESRQQKVTTNSGFYN